VTPRSEQHDDELSGSSFNEQVQGARRNRELITWLARWRAEHGPSQAEVAKRMHTSQPAVARLESHQHDAQLSTLARYVAALELALDFTLTDSISHTRVWTSIEELGPERDMEVAEATESESPAITELPGWVIIDGTWDRLSEQDLERQPCLMAASEEPGWTLVYAKSEVGSVALEDVTIQGGYTEPAEDPQVLGLFGPEDPDPIAIATSAESDTNEFGGLHTLVAKVRKPSIEHIEHLGGTASNTYADSLVNIDRLVYLVDHLKSVSGEVPPSSAEDERPHQMEGHPAERGLNRRDLINEVSGRVGGRKTATEAVNVVLDTIQHRVAKGNKVSITEFGISEQSIKRSRKARHPVTGAYVKVQKFRAGSDLYVKIPASSVQKFRAGSDLYVKVPASSVQKFRAGSDIKAPFSGKKKFGIGKTKG
jgi:DNA-binding protein HU-beta